jgi:hypothetical protein
MIHPELTPEQLIEVTRYAAQEPKEAVEAAHDFMTLMMLGRIGKANFTESAPDVFHVFTVAFMRTVMALDDQTFAVLSLQLGRACGKPNCTCHIPAGMMLDFLKQLRTLR